MSWDRAKKSTLLEKMTACGCLALLVSVLAAPWTFPAIGRAVLSGISDVGEAWRGK